MSFIGKNEIFDCLKTSNISEDCIEELFENLEELEIFRELYPNSHAKGSLLSNYLTSCKDFVEFLDNNAFELKNDMEIIKKYAEEFIRRHSG